jgi:creatinine amidohydrolase
MREFKLERMTYLDSKEYAKKGSIVMLPVSPLEAHGPHLPLSVDILGAETMAELSVKNLNSQGIPAVMAPVLPIGISNASIMFNGTISVKPETLKSVISDIAESFKQHKFKGMAIITQHLEKAHFETLMEVSVELTKRDIHTMTANPIGKTAGVLFKMLSGDIPQGDLHAGELETSFCLWKCPELVKTEIMKDLKPCYVERKKELKEEWDFIKAGATDCYLGAPALGRAELGVPIYEVIVEAIVQEVESWASSL